MGSGPMQWESDFSSEHPLVLTPSSVILQLLHSSSFVNNVFFNKWVVQFHCSIFTYFSFTIENTSSRLAVADSDQFDFCHRCQVRHKYNLCSNPFPGNPDCCFLPRPRCDWWPGWPCRVCGITEYREHKTSKSLNGSFPTSSKTFLLFRKSKTLTWHSSNGIWEAFFKYTMPYYGTSAPLSHSFDMLQLRYLA